jgi:predicted O-methyltransferase YrrM
VPDPPPFSASQVVETGVAHGVTSRFVLEALQRNGGGRLWSIDVPPLLQPELHQEIGVAVPDALRTDWTLIRGSSRRRLPALLDTIMPIDLCIRDSLHTTENVLFALRRVWPRGRAGGAVVVDDVDVNDGFRTAWRRRRTREAGCVRLSRSALMTGDRTTKGCLG